MAMSDRTIPKQTPETGVAFRAGVKGLPFTENSGPQRELHVQTDAESGPNERHMETIEELPGLSDPLAAYEAGRALRMIGYIFDEQGSPVSAAGAFVPKVAAAVLYFALRGERQPFGAADMAFVFLETCTPADAPREMREQTEAAILKYARQRPTIATRMR
jgi:hypothetical protein